MNKVIQTTLLLVMMVLAGSLSAQPESPVISQVHQAIKEANAGSLASHFHATVDLKLAETDGKFSKGQAEMIVKDFFNKNPVKSFTVKHQGSSDDGSKYSIGMYVNKSAMNFRVYILLKPSGEGLRINQLQFEED